MFIFGGLPDQKPQKCKKTLFLELKKKSVKANIMKFKPNVAHTILF